MNTGQEFNRIRQTTRSTPPTFGNSAVGFLYYLRLICILVLGVNLSGAVGFAQGQSPPLKPRETNISRLDRARRLAYHTRFLRQVAKSSPMIEVVWNMEEVFTSLRFIAENGSGKDNDAAKAVGSIFKRTEDAIARDLCLSALKRIGNKVAKGEMLRIYNDATVPSEWRAACAEYLQIVPAERSAATGAAGGSSINTLQKQ